MATVANVVAKFEADTSDLQAGAKRVTSSMQGIQADVTKAAKGMSGLKVAVGAALGAAAVAGITSAARAFTQFATASIDAARQSEITVRRLDQIASSMGILDTVLGGSTQRLQDYADTLMKQTGTDDEVIKSAQAIILTFRDVASSAGETSGHFDRATKAALDLAAAGFGSVEGNARSLARALQDPLRGLTMLSRQGVTFTATEREKIKSLVESNRLLEAQAIILGAVETQVGGTAAATATATQKMRTAFGEVQESIGYALLPVVESIADAINTHVMPALQGFADEAKSSIGPSLAQSFTDALPTLLDLGKAFLDIAEQIRSAMQPAMQLILRLLQAVVPAIELLAKVLGAIPGPIMAIVGALLILRTRMMQTFVGSMNTATRTVQLSFANMRVAATTAAASIRASFTAMATAAKGFMVGLGPVGWALIGLTVAFEVFSSRSAEAEARAMEYKDALDQVTGAATRASQEMTIFNLMQKEVGGLYGIGARSFEDLATKAGLSMSEISTALHGTTAEYDAFIERLKQAAEQGTINWTEYSLLNDALHEERSALEAARIELDNKNRAEAEAAAATAGATSATVAAAIAAGEAMGPTKGLSMAIGGLGDEAGEAAEEIDAMRQEYETWLSVTSQISAVDAAAASIDKLGASAVEFGTDLMGQSPKARDFRADVIKAFEDSAKAAQSLSDDLPTQRAIFTGELIKIVSALRTSGVKPKDIEAFLGAMDGLPASVADIMRQAAKQIGDTDFKTNVEKAFKKSVRDGAPMTADAMARLAEGASKAAKEKLGLTLEPELAAVIKSGTTALRPTAFGNGELTGRSMGSGLSTGILRSSPTVQAAIRRVIQQAHEAAKDEAQSTSPSRLFARTGDDIGSGLALGITRSKGKVSAAAQELINQILKSVRSALAPAMGTMESAIADVLANLPSVKDAEQALKDNDTAANRAALAFAKYAESNRKALRALQELGAGFDYILAKMDSVTGALTELQELTAKPFGIDSNVFNMFTSDIDIEGIARNATDLIAVVTEAFGVLTDPKIVGAKAARENRKQLRGTINQITALAQEGIDLRKKYEENLQKIADLEEAYQKQVGEINAKYDALEKAGQDNLASLEKQLSETNAAYERENGKLQQLITERSNFLDGVTKGFRSFVNDFKGAVQGGSVVLKQSTQRLADGITISFDEMSTAGAGIAGNLRKRLDDVRTFAANVRTLIERGLDQSVIREFVEAGPSQAGDIVAALAVAGDDELREINSIQGELAAQATEFGSYLSGLWFDAGIAAQQAIVAPLEAQRVALEQAIVGAKAYLETLKAERQKALDEARAAFDEEKTRLEEENVALLARMDEIAAEIEGLIAELAATLPAETLKAGQDAAQKLLDGFRKKYPKVFNELNQLMTALARSMARETTITVRTVYEGTGMLPGRAAGGPVQARTAYLVGERGPEVFVPYARGNIIANHELGTTPRMALGSRTSSVVVEPGAVQITIPGGMIGSPDRLEQYVSDAVERGLADLANEILAS